MRVRTFDVFGTDSFGIGLEVLCLRQEVNEANAAATTAGQTAAGLGQNASGELANLGGIYNKEENAQHLYDPTQTSEMLTAAGAGIGGAEGAEAAAMQRQAATTGNASGATKGLQELARDKMKANAGVSEGIAAQDVTGALGLRQAGIAGEQGLYGENLKGQLAAMGQQSSDINAATQASQTGWLQQAEGVAKTAAGIASPWMK